MWPCLFDLYPFFPFPCSKTLNTILSNSRVSLNLSFLLLLFFPIKFNVGYGSISYSFYYADVCSLCLCSPGFLSWSDVELIKSPFSLCWDSVFSEWACLYALLHLLIWVCWTILTSLYKTTSSWGVCGFCCWVFCLFIFLRQGFSV